MTARTRLQFDGDNRTGRAFREIESSMQRLQGGMRSLAVLGKAFVAALGVRQLVRIGQETLNYADKLQKLNQRLGTSTEFLSRLRFMAEQSGVGFDSAAMALQRMARRVAEAAAGSGPAAKALADLGIEATKLSRLSIEQQFEVLGQALRGVASETEKVRLAYALFGQQGVELLQIIGETNDEYRALAKEAGGAAVVTQEMADKAARANDAMNRVRTAFREVTQELAINFAPAIEKVANFIAREIPTAGMAAEAALWKMAEGFYGALEWLMERLARFADRLEMTFRVLRMEGSADYMQGMAESLRAMGDRMEDASTKSGNLAAGLVALRISIQEAGRAAGMTGDQVEKMLDAVRVRQIEEVAIPNLRRVVNTVAEPSRFADLFSRLGDGVADSLVAGIERGAEGMRNTFRMVLADLASMALRSTLVQILGGIGGGGGVMAAMFGGNRQAGGSVMGGRAYKVGESGPEWFVPQSSGAIMANSMGGGGARFTYNIDARGADPSAELRIRAAMAQAQMQTEARLRDEQRRGRF